MGKLNFHGRTYDVKQDDEKYYFNDESDREFKIHFTFSKDPEKNKIAEDGLRTFWTEVYS